MCESCRHPYPQGLAGTMLGQRAVWQRGEATPQPGVGESTHTIQVHAGIQESGRAWPRVGCPPADTLYGSSAHMGVWCGEVGHSLVLTHTGTCFPS